MSKKQVFVPKCRVTVVRDGAHVSFNAGVACELTDDEVADIRKAEKATGQDMLREPNDEAALVVAEVDVSAVFAELARKASDAISVAGTKGATKKQQDIAKAAVKNVLAFAKANKVSPLPEDIAKAGEVKVDEFANDDEGL